MIGSSGNGSNAVNYTSLHTAINSLSAEEMFRKLSGESAGNSPAALPKVGKPLINADGSLVADENMIKEQMKENISYLRPKVRTPGKVDKDDSELPVLYGQNKNDAEYSELFYDGKASITKSFSALAVEIGAFGDKISKAQLMAYLDSIKYDPSSTDKSIEIAFVKNLIAQFDDLSHGSDYITSLTGLAEIQDYTTVTSAQVTPPIDLRV